MSTAETIQACSAHVMRVLGKGHREAVYHKALSTALNRRGLCHRSEVSCPILFMGECVGVGRADLIVDDVVVEVKATQNPPTEAALKQLRKYVLAFSKTERQPFSGLVVNFNQSTGRTDVREVLSFAAPPSRTTRSAVRSGAFLRSLHSTPQRVPAWALRTKKGDGTNL